MRLQAVVACVAVPVALPQGTGQPPGRVVGRADIAHLALPYQVVEGAQGLVQRGLPVVGVRLVEVDVVGLQAGQRGLDGVHDVAAREALVVRPVAHRSAHLRGDHQAVAVAALLHPPADDLF